MDFIQNADLREWVKKSLKKALFQKAHELAVQTGCEVLLKVQDITVTDAPGTQYYGTRTLQRAYENNRLVRRPGEVLVSGDTGLPIAVKVDRGVQISGSPGGDSYTNSAFASGNDTGDRDFLQDSAVNTEKPGLINAMDSNEQEIENGQGNHLPADDLFNSDKIDLTQDSDSDDSIVEVKQELGNGNSFKQEPMDQQMYIDQPTVFNHPTPYQCGVCQKAFTNLQVLENHNRTEHVHSRKPSNGSMLNTVTSVQQQQEAMVSFKLEPNSYTCIRCHNSFKDSSLLHNHLTQCHMETATTTSYGGVMLNQTAANFTNAKSQSPRQLPGIPATVGSPQSLPQITSVTSLKLMPDGLNMSAAATTPVKTVSPSFQSPGSVNRGSLSSSPSRGSLSSSPRGSPHGSSPRDKQRRHALADLGSNSKMSRRNIMAAILQTASPVVTHRSVNTRWPFLRMLTAKQFLDAANQLSQENFGLVHVPPGGGQRSSPIFVKKQPDQVQETIQEHPDLCTLEEFTKKYHQPLPKSIAGNKREKLIAMGFAGE